MSNKRTLKTKIRSKPPVADKISKRLVINGDLRIDDYFWLRDKSNKKVINYLKSENNYTNIVMKHTSKLQKKLYRETISRMKETDISVPYKVDNYYYYTRTKKGKQYSMQFRKKGSPRSKEEKLLDLNELASGHSYLGLGVYDVSPNHKMLAYSTTTTGTDSYALYIKDIETGKLLDKIDNTSDMVWFNDNKNILYTTIDKTYRPCRLYRHEVGRGKKNDELIYEEKDNKYYLGVYKSDSKDFIFRYSSSRTTTEVGYLSTDKPKGYFRTIHPRQKDLEYRVQHHGDNFYILTNDKAKNFKLMITPVAKPSKKNWHEVISHRKGVKLQYMKLFRNYLVLIELENALQKIHILDILKDREHYINFDEPAYSVALGPNEEFGTNALRLSYSSFITPTSIYDYEMGKKILKLRKRYKVRGYNPSHYRSERVNALSNDRAKIPISLVYKKGFARNGKSPLLLEGYGAYGSAYLPSFNLLYPSLLDRGFVCAIAHVRGGGEKGREWYDNGKLLKKKNTFVDFIHCAEYLISSKYTEKDKLVISGGSAGGLLVGAVINMRPDLFKGVITAVPFVDTLTTMLDSSLPLTTSEYEEWGNPNEKRYYDYIKSYSPYDNVKAQDYPNMLVTTSINDTRVPYWEPTKWVAKIRALKKDKNALLLKINLSAGHGGSSGRYDSIKDWAFKYAFVLDIVGITE